MMEPFVKSEKITIEQYWVMRLLYERGVMRVKDIADRIGTTSSPVTISVKRLEARGFVKRKRSSDDERVVSVSLTTHGREVFELWRKKRQRLLSEYFDALDMKEKRTLLALLDKISRSIAEKKARTTLSD
jgi:MarR family transcriptional regulator, 2-MHQ and catechol-resistance regulon repressor